ncbi:MAG: DUF2752 domain-containing protein [Lachnospiraceae bacterium]|nr:DUF2752 domain-containing protein [Lachnospiraceae bacterium]
MTYMKKVCGRILSDIRQNSVALIIILIYLALTQYFFHTVCPLKIVTGLDCPACGLTRASLLLLTGHITEALERNASVVCWVPLILYFCIFRYLVGKKPPFALLLATLSGIITIVIFLVIHIF